MRQRNAVAALGFVHEMGREKDSDTIITGEIDQRAPESVAGDRINARRGFVENKYGRPVQNGYCKLQSLFDPKWQAFVRAWQARLSPAV